ncbi:MULTISPECIES: transporter [unclassified Flavobacterium]|uniref:transporter n=1 Tax=unclassified Flavobacterium TaxID=196869 RepID=UPI00129225F9|nr:MULTISPECIES: transporter [unclassified Flavobacterium]MQP52216.1 transporter [Flavobacterium sp. LMO9]MQP62286.1 transporter [Flavobacterium sp. LMO6]
MKNIYQLLFFLTFQLGLSTEIDSLSNNPFSTLPHFSYDILEDCDACGCSASGGSMGFASMLNTNFVGIRYFNQSYKSSDGLYSNSPWYTENFNTIQLWARIPVANRIQISALLPYHFHNRETNTGNQNSSGLGDVTVLGMYQLFQTHKDSTLFIHSLQAGAGIKIPIGKFDELNNGSVNPSYQVGTGSWDYLLATEYVIRRKQIGLNTLLNYVIKTENDKKYRFGNQLNYAGTFFYLHQKNNYSFAPQLGIAGEVYESNYQLGQKVRNTCGDILFGKIGFELGKEKLSFGANFMLPITQNLTGGNVEANYRWSLNFNYSL